jgi:hypothetical protein
MISNVLSRWLDNGFSLKRAIKDERYLRKNIRDFDTNINKLKQLLGTNLAYEHHEYEVYSEPGYYIGIFHKGFHFTVYFHERFYPDSKDKLYTINITPIDSKEDYYGANSVVEHIYNIEHERLKIVPFSNDIIDTIFNEIKSKKLEGIYEDMDDAKIELKEKINSI